MPRKREPCKRCNSATPGVHAASCRYATARAPVTLPPIAAKPQAPPKMRKRVFTIDHEDGSETTITVAGPAGAVKCNSTEQSVQVWTGENAPHPIVAQQQPLGRSPLVSLSTDVSRSGLDYTVTDELDTVPGGTLGLSDEDAMNPDKVLERMRLGMIGRMSAETSSSDVLLIPDGPN